MDSNPGIQTAIRIVGLDRVRLDEYPAEALREALVNAVAHRDYEDGSRKIMLEVFPDRVVISSPGLPPPPITLQKLRSRKYRPCSRNPILAQCLSFFHRIEERGSGFRRMHDQSAGRATRVGLDADASGMAGRNRRRYGSGEARMNRDAVRFGTRQMFERYARDRR